MPSLQQGMGKEETKILVKISAAAPTPMMHRKAAEAFERLRRIVRDEPLGELA